MRTILQGFLAFSFLGMTTACIPPRVDNRGYADAYARMKDITVGQTTREEVREMLGSPSLTNHFGDEIWYYVAERKEAVAFLEPEVTDQKVTRIIFDRSGIVKEMKGYDLKDSQNVQVATEITPTEGQELGFFEQILGNVGRFNTNEGPAATRGSRSGGVGGPLGR